MGLLGMPTALGLVPGGYYKWDIGGRVKLGKEGAFSFSVFLELSSVLGPCKWRGL